MAFELSGRLSARKRYLFQGDFYANTERAYDKAFNSYNMLLQLYPDDENGNENLGNLFSFLELWDKAIERYEVNIKNKVDSYVSYLGLADVYMAKGLYDKAKEILEYYINNFSDNYWIRRQLAVIYLCQRKFDFALIEIDKSISLDPENLLNFGLKGEFYLYKGDLVRFEEEQQKILETEEQARHIHARIALGHLNLLKGKYEKTKDQFEQGLEVARKLGQKETETAFYSRLAYLYLKSGNTEAALEESKKSERSAKEERGCMFCHQEWALHYKGLAYIEKKSMDEALRTADELKALIQQGMRKNYMRLYFHMIGTMELKKENYPKAIKYFKKAVSLLFSPYYVNFNDQALFINSLAFAYYKAGDLEKARDEYERITFLTKGILYWGDIYAKSFYMLGKIYEQQGDESKAIENYKKFLDLWKDADPGIAEVEDAKKRLAGLKSQ
jgi:tetratricopeptide (TPR) repeat protein